ncbi:Elongator subunit elp4 [Phlyctochytrium planicorne]|nr:Elongator subunit elp4 [Phlyctochytrium planicorne]
MSSFKRRTPTSSTAPSPRSSVATSPGEISPSFVKATNALPLSSRISPHNGSVQTSFGIPSLDGVLGGGLPSGSVLLIQEDYSTGYSALLQRYFLAQGAAAGHGILLASADEDPHTVLESLMAPVGLEDDGEEDEEAGKATARTLGALRTGDDRMSIAWRYQNQPRVSTTISGAAAIRKGDGPYCYKFDITKTIPKTTLEAAAATIAVVDVNSWSAEGKTARVIYSRLYSAIQEFSRIGPYEPTKTASPRSFLRIAISAVGSPFWGTDAGSLEALNELYRFITSLRALLKNIYGVCVITLPGHLYNDAHGVSSSYAIKRLYHACDGVLEVESFSGSSRIFPPEYTTDYHGLLHVHRLPTPNSLTSGTPLSMSDLHSLAFKVRRKRFTVETFQLPPETEEADKSPSSGKDAMMSIGSSPVSTSSCSTGTGKASKLDF